MSSATVMTDAPAAVDERTLVDFVHHEVELLDERRFEEWAALYTEDGYYWAPVGQAQGTPLNHVSLFYDDLRTIHTRIARLRHPRNYVQTPPSRTVHMVGNFRRIVASGSNEVEFRCNFTMFEFRLTKGQQIYGGTYDYRLRRVGEDWRIVSKKASLVNSEDMFPSLAVWF